MGDGLSLSRLAFGGYAGYGCGGSAVIGQPDAEVGQPDLPPPDTAADKVEPADVPYPELPDLFPDIEVCCPDVPDTPDLLDTSEVPDLPIEISPEVPDIPDEKETELPCQPEPEKCNGLDDNCDGETDEGLTETTYSGFPPNSQNIPPCQPQIMVCEGGLMVIKQFEVVPLPEIVCNEIDEDCDGKDSLGSPPSSFNLTYPFEGALKVPYVGTSFQWQSSLDPEQSNVTYDLYLAKAPEFNDSQIIGPLSSNNYNLENNKHLTCATTYYWKVRATDNCGNITWSNNYQSFSTGPVLELSWKYAGPTETVFSRPNSLAIDQNGNLIAVGRVWGDLPGKLKDGWDFWTAKYDPTGTNLWTYFFDDGYYDEGHAVFVDSANNYYFTGELDDAPVTEPPSPSVYYSFSLRISEQGNFPWLQSANNKMADVNAFGITADPASGSVYVTGTLSFKNLWIQKLDILSGEQIWAKTFDSANTGRGIAMGIDGNILVTGSKNNDVVLLSFDPSGAQQWVKTYAGPAMNSTESGQSIILDNYGNIYMVADMSYWGGGGKLGVMIQKHDSLGDVLWTQYNKKTPNMFAWQNDGGRAITLSPDNKRIYVTGFEYTDLQGEDAWIASLDATSGEILCVQYYNYSAINGNDKGKGIALDASSGSLYITGSETIDIFATQIFFLKYSGF